MEKSLDFLMAGNYINPHDDEEYLRLDTSKKKCKKYKFECGERFIDPKGNYAVFLGVGPLSAPSPDNNRRIKIGKVEETPWYYVYSPSAGYSEGFYNIGPSRCWKARWNKETSKMKNSKNKYNSGKR